MGIVLEADEVRITFSIITIEARYGKKEIWLFKAGDDEGMQVSLEDIDELLLKYYEANF